jgi:hypothetical protein
MLLKYCMVVRGWSADAKVKGQHSSLTERKILVVIRLEGSGGHRQAQLKRVTTTSHHHLPLEKAYLIQHL